MPPRRRRAVAARAVQLLQQLSIAQDLEAWCIALQQSGSGCETLALAHDVEPCTPDDLVLHLIASTNTLRLVFKDVTSALGVDPHISRDVLKLLGSTNICVRQAAVDRMLEDQEVQHLKQALSETGITQVLASAIDVTAAALIGLRAATGPEGIYAATLRTAVAYGTFLLQTWACLSGACLKNSLGTAPLAGATLPAVRLAAQLPALLCQLKPVVTSKRSNMDIQALYEAYAWAADELPSVAVVAGSVCELLIARQPTTEPPAAVRELLLSDELLLLLLMALGWLTQSQQQQQKQPPYNGTPPHKQLLSALGAGWIQITPGAKYSLDGVFRDYADLQGILSTILGMRSSADIKSSSATSVSVMPLVPEHLQLPLLKALIEQAHLEHQLRHQEQLRPCQACDLFRTLKLVTQLVKLISSSQTSNSSSSSTARAAAVTCPWPVLPAAAAAGLLKPVMQQLSAVVLSTLNTNSSTSSSSSSSEGPAAAASSPPAVPADPSSENDRRGVTYCYGNLLITLCLSVEPKHLAAALVPDVLTPITLLEATLRAQAQNIAPTDRHEHQWLGVAANGDSSSSSSRSIDPGYRVTVLDLQPIALRVLQSLHMASADEAFRSAVATAALASAVDEQGVLLQKLPTLSLTCRKIGQAAAAAQEHSGVGQAASAAAEMAAIAAHLCTNIILEVNLNSVLGITLVSTVTMAKAHSSSVCISKPAPCSPAVVLPYVVLVARALRVYVQHWLLLLQEQQLPAQEQPMPSGDVSAAGAEAAEVAAVAAAAAAAGTGGSKAPQDLAALTAPVLPPPAAAAADPQSMSVASSLAGLQSVISTCRRVLNTVSIFADSYKDKGISLESWSSWPKQSSQLAAVCGLRHLLQDAEDLLAVVGHTANALDNIAADVKAVASSQAAVDNLPEEVEQLQQRVISIAQQVDDFALSVCASIPLSVCCNNPDCVVLAKLGESQLVCGKGCVCGGCGLARYCCGECQKKHWSRHKATCKLAKQQRAAVIQAVGKCRGR